MLFPVPEAPPPQVKQHQQQSIVLQNPSYTNLPIENYNAFIVWVKKEKICDGCHVGGAPQ